MQIGVESGEVLADLCRSTSERDLFVTGDAVNTASRLQAAAERGSVVVGPTTYAATRDLIAALVALRRSDGDAAAARAQAAADELAYHPMLGPLPETRWAQVGAGS